MKKTLSLIALSLVLSLVVVPAKNLQALSSYIASGTMGDSANTSSALILRDTSGNFAAGQATLTSLIVTPEISTTALAAITPASTGLIYLVYDLQPNGTKFTNGGIGIAYSTSTNGTGLGNYVWLSTVTTANIGKQVS